MNPSTYRRYLLAVLLLILASNYVDRLAMGLVLQSIKFDLHLSDTQLGVLTGIAFATFYSVMGIPIARWADRGNRRTIIAITTALWSAAVMLSAAARNFSQLLCIRIGAAVGEAGCIPTAHSLIANYFDRDERPRAVSVYMMGGSFSVVVGYFLAGWLNEIYGWRITFVLIAMPGVVLSVIAAITLREPRRETHTTVVSSEPSIPSLREVSRTLWSSRTFRHVLLGFAVSQFFGFGILQWQPAFFVRSYGLTTGVLGTCFTLIAGLGSLLGNYAGGHWASRYAASRESRQLKAIALAYGIFALSSAFTYLSPNAYLAFTWLAVGMIGGATLSGPLLAVIQTLVPDQMRATSMALIYFSANLIGMGLGPFVAGALSDALSPVLGPESLRYALLILSPGYFWAAWHAWKASQTVAEDIRLVQLNCEAFRRGLGL